MTKQRVRGASRFVVMCLLWSVVASCGGPGTPATNDLTYFAIEADDNPGLGADAVGTINVDSVTVLVPAGTNLTSLKATFQTTGTSVTVGSVEQQSGVTVNNFTTTVTYTVAAANGATHVYSVNVVAGSSPTNDLTAFSFLDASNTALSADVVATINGTSVAATVPFGTDVTALVATFTHNGVAVTVGGVTQASGVTANNFTSPVAYTVVASNSATKVYTVTVTIASSTAKDITAFSFLDATNTALTADVVATINGTAIAATVPFGTDVTALVATFTTTGQSVRVGATVQVSGTTANDFTAAVSYVVTAADNSTKTYTVTVTIAAGTAKDITAFSFLDASNPALTADVTATINGTAIAATVPFGTNVTALVATFTITGVSIAVGATPQVSGTTANDFTTSVTYVVTAGDNSTKTYTVTVTIAANPANDITAFAFLDATNPALTADVTAVINGTAITATVPFGTDVTALIATFSTTGASVAVGATPQASGITPNDFTAAVSYVVTAADSSTKTYIVTITIAANPAKDITAFSFLDATNPALSADVTALINGTAITATVPFGTDVTALIATFSTTGAMVTVGVTTQASGITPNDFTAAVTYVVTAGDSTTKTYTVTITIAPNAAKDITAFSFLDATNAALSADVTATINGAQITAVVPSGTDVTALIATFTHTGASVAVGATPQISGITANNFTSSVTYVVTAGDNSTKSYTVTVTTPRMFAMPRVRTSAMGAASPVTTVIRGAYAALTAPTSAMITVRLYDPTGNLLSTICNPCTATLTGASRSYVLDISAAAIAAGVTTALDGYAIIEVTGDHQRVAISGTTETKVNGSATNVMLDVAQVVEPISGAHKLLLGPAQENNANTPATPTGFDVRITMLHLGGQGAPAGTVDLRVFGSNGQLLTHTLPVCPPCTFSPGGGTPRIDTTIQALRAAAGGTGLVNFLGTVDVTGVRAGNVVVIAEKEEGSTTSPSVVSRSVIPLFQERVGAGSSIRIVTPHFTQSSSSDEYLEVGSFTGLGTGTLPTATIVHHVLDANGQPVLGNLGQPVVGGGTIGAGFQIERSTLANMASPQTVTPAVDTFLFSEIDGPAAAGVHASKTSAGALPSTESRVRSLDIPQTNKTFVIPHVLEHQGKIPGGTNTFDTTVFANYVAGIGTGTGTSATIDLYLFDQTTGGPLKGNDGTDVCAPCTTALNTTIRKATILLDDLISAHGGTAFGTMIGFGVLVVGGQDPDNVAVQGFVVNAHSAPIDLSVFGFDPVPITAAP